MSNRKIVKKDSVFILSRNTWSETEAKLLASFIKELTPIVKPKEPVFENKDNLTEEQKELLSQYEIALKEYESIEFPEMVTTIDELERLWKCKLNTTQIDNICIDLKSKTYALPGVNDKGNPITMYRSLFDEIDYHHLEKKITYTFHRSMKPYLLAFAQQFVSYNIDNILRFKSKYSISFYERFKLQTQFKKEPMITEIIEINELREWLNLNVNPKTNNLKKDKYVRMNDFKKRILEVVKNDLQKYSDVYMNYEFIKKYRTVTHIKFSFTKQTTEIQQSFFNDDELETAYDKFVGKQLKNNDGDVLTIRQITEALQDVDYVKAIVYNEFVRANQEVKIKLSTLKKL